SLPNDEGRVILPPGLLLLDHIRHENHHECQGAGYQPQTQQTNHHNGKSLQDVPSRPAIRPRSPYRHPRRVCLGVKAHYTVVTSPFGCHCSGTSCSMITRAARQTRFSLFRRAGTLSLLAGLAAIPAVTAAAEE